jgi:hypothetical protein
MNLSEFFGGGAGGEKHPSLHCDQNQDHGRMKPSNKSARWEKCIREASLPACPQGSPFDEAKPIIFRCSEILVEITGFKHTTVARERNDPSWHEQIDQLLDLGTRVERSSYHPMNSVEQAWKPMPTHGNSKSVTNRGSTGRVDALSFIIIGFVHQWLTARHLAPLARPWAPHIISAQIGHCYGHFSPDRTKKTKQNKKVWLR